MRIAGTQCRTQINLLAPAKAGVKLPGRRHPQTIAPCAEIAGVRSDEAEPAAGFRHIDIARRAASGVLAFGQRPALLQPRAHLIERQILVEPFLLDIAQRHHFDQGDIVALPMRPADQIGQFVLVDAFQRHGVQLDLQPRRHGCGDPFEHLAQRIAPGQCGKLRPVERIERHIHPPHPGLGQRLGVLCQLRAVGGQRQFVQTMPQPAAQRAEQINDVTPHQRFAPGDADLRYPARDEGGGEIVEFLQRQHIGFGQKGHAFGHAVRTAQVAAVSHRQPQIGDPALKAVDQRLCPVVVAQQSGLQAVSHGTPYTAPSRPAHLPKTAASVQELRRATRPPH